MKPTTKTPRIKLTSIVNMIALCGKIQSRCKYWTIDCYHIINPQPIQKPWDRCKNRHFFSVIAKPLFQWQFITFVFPVFFLVVNIYLLHVIHILISHFIHFAFVTKINLENGLPSFGKVNIHKTQLSVIPNVQKSTQCTRMVPFVCCIAD